MSKLVTMTEAALVAALQRLTDLNRRAKRAILVALDLLICLLSVSLAFSLRLSDWVTFTRETLIVTAIVLPSWLVVATWRGVYRSIVRYSGGRTMLNLGASVALSAIPGIVILLFISIPLIPRTVALIQPMVFLLSMAMIRVFARHALVEIATRHLGAKRKTIIIYGAGAAGRQLAASIRHEPNVDIVAFVDDDAKLIGERLDGVSIASPDQLPALIEVHKVSDVLLALPSIPRSRRMMIVKQLVGLLVHVQILPGVRELIDGTVSANDLREVQVEDLLGRDPVPPQCAAAAQDDHGAHGHADGRGRLDRQ